MSRVDTGSNLQDLPVKTSAMIALLLSVLLTATVHGQSISVESDAALDFSKFKTFAVRDGKLTSRSPALNSDLTKKRIASEIEAALTAKGLSGVTDHADLDVTFELGSARIREAKPYPAGWRGHGTRIVNVPQSEGTLVIDLHEASTNTLVWRSIAVESEPNPVKLADKLDKLVKKALTKYPKLKKSGK